MSKCLHCSNDSHGHKYCEKCVSLRANACSVINYNSKQLQKLFATKWFTPNWFERFELYVDNIRKQEAVLMDFLEKDTRRRFELLR